MSILQLTRFYKQPVAISALSPRMRTRKAFMDGLHHVISVWSILAIALFWNAPAVSTLLVESHHSHFYIKFSFRELFLLLLIASRKPRNYLYAITIPLCFWDFYVIYCFENIENIRNMCCANFWWLKSLILSLL